MKFESKVETDLYEFAKNKTQEKDLKRGSEMKNRHSVLIIFVFGSYLKPFFSFSFLFILIIFVMLYLIMNI